MRQVQARTGALMEALEWAAGERPRAPGLTAAFADLPDRLRAPEFSDFCVDRRAWASSGEQLGWVLARDAGGAPSLYVPLACLDMDFTRAYPDGLYRASNGTAAGRSPDEAKLSSLCELLERDCVARWRNGQPGRLALTDIAAPVFQRWRRRLERRGFSLQVWCIAGKIGLPAFRCQLWEHGPAPACGPVVGAGAHPSRDAALLRALAECLQARVTLIAGAREDIEAGDFGRAAGAGRWASLLAMSGAPDLRWRDTPDWKPADPSRWLGKLIRRLPKHGLNQTGFVDLSDPAVGVPVFRAFVPGLGVEGRGSRW